MSSTIYELHGQVGVITMNNPPVNGLGFDLRRDIVEGLARADADANVKVVVLIGSPRAFSGGADIREFGSPKATAEPNLNTVIRHLENARKPVVAAIGGACMGGGLELAMGCHFRVAAKGLAGKAPFDLLVGGVKVGSFTTNAAGSGRIWTPSRTVGEPASRPITVTFHPVRASDRASR